MELHIETWKNRTFLPMLALLTLAACSNDGPSAPDPTAQGDVALLVRVEPTGGTTDVEPGSVVILTFDHAMDPAMSSYADVHEGDLAGPRVSGVWDWLDGHTRMRFTPSDSLQPGTTYATHVGGGLIDQEGRVVDLETHRAEMGGVWTTDAMMNDGMGDRVNPADHMGGAWDDSNGNHGMVFTFTTGG